MNKINSASAIPSSGSTPKTHHSISTFLHKIPSTSRNSSPALHKSSERISYPGNIRLPKDDLISYLDRAGPSRRVRIQLAHLSKRGGESPLSKQTVNGSLVKNLPKLKSKPLLDKIVLLKNVAQQIDEHQTKEASIQQRSPISTKHQKNSKSVALSPIVEAKPSNFDFLEVLQDYLSAKATKMNNVAKSIVVSSQISKPGTQRSPGLLSLRESPVNENDLNYGLNLKGFDKINMEKISQDQKPVLGRELPNSDRGHLRHKYHKKSFSLSQKVLPPSSQIDGNLEQAENKREDTFKRYKDLKEDLQTEEEHLQAAIKAQEQKFNFEKNNMAKRSRFKIPLINLDR